MEDSKKPERHIVVMVALPASGKTTYIKNTKELEGYTVLSVDNIVKELRDKIHTETGEDVSMDTARMRNNDFVVEELYRRLQKAVDRGENVIIDRSSPTVVERARSLKIAKSSKDFNYKSTAVIIHPPSEGEHIDRLITRARHERRHGVLNDVGIFKMEPIGKQEFDKVIEVGTPADKPLYWEYKKAAENPISLVALIEESRRRGSSELHR